MSRRELMGAGLSAAAIAIPLGKMPEARQGNSGENSDAELITLFEEWQRLDKAGLRASFKEDELWQAALDQLPSDQNSREYHESRERLGLNALYEESLAAGVEARKVARRLIATPVTTIQGLYLKLLAAEGIDLNSDEAKVFSGQGYEGRDLVLSALADAKRMSQS